MNKEHLDIESMLYRMEKLDKKMEDYKNLVSGMKKSFLPAIVKRRGHFSDYAIEKLVNELVEGIADSRFYFDKTYNPYRTPVERKPLTDEERKFYSAYFYLLIGTALHYKTDVHFFDKLPDFNPGTWGALLERANEEISYSSKAELDRDLLVFSLPGLHEKTPAGLFDDVANAYLHLTGKDYSSVISDEDREAAKKLMSEADVFYLGNPEAKLEEEMEEFEYQQKAMQEYMNSDDYWEDEEYYSNLDDNYDNEDDDEPDELGETDESGDSDASGESGASAASRFRENDPDLIRTNDNEPDKIWEYFFRDRDSFVKNCKILREGMDTVKTGSLFTKQIDMSIRLYMWRNGISQFSDDDRYFTMIAYMNKIIKASKQTFERPREWKFVNSGRKPLQN